MKLVRPVLDDQCDAKKFMHMGLVRVTCRHRTKVVGVWLHVGSRLYMIASDYLAEAMDR